MKVLGRIGGDEFVLCKEDSDSALALVDTFPDVTGDVKTIQLSKSIDGHLAGDIFVSDGKVWNKIIPPIDTVGSVTGLIYPRLGCDVQIRWTDPVDVKPFVWKHTLVMRKYGSYPTNVYDGVVVTDSHVRNQYRDNPYHDFVPAGTEDGWYYRMFTFSEDEVSHTSDSCKFVPIDLSWKNLPSIVRDGNANKVFALGDVVTINTSCADPMYRNLELEVVRFDGISMEDLELNHSITFATVNVIGNGVRFDKPWNEYILTTDKFVSSRTKVYYALQNGEYVALTNLRLGSRIPDNTYYERVTSISRTEYGGNRWANCNLRRWMNSTDVNDRLESMVPPLTKFDKEVVDVIATVRNRTVFPDTDGDGSEISLDKLYLLSATEVFNDIVTKVRYDLTSDTETKEQYVPTLDSVRNPDKTYYILSGVRYLKCEAQHFNDDGSFISSLEYLELIPTEYYVEDPGSPSGYRLATDVDFTESRDFIPGVKYYEEIRTVIDENGYCPQFFDTEINSRVKTTVNGINSSWWLRTANINSETEVCSVNKDGEKTFNRVDTKENRLVIAFTVA